jgi:purine-binding chemotaxis protein CheW
MNESPRQYCTFCVDTLLLGVDVQQVQEVIRYQAMTRVPLANKVISGLINLRGQIVTAIDLREQLGLPPRSPERNPMNVVVRDGEEVVSLLVDEIGDVIEVTADSFESPPATARASLRDLITGAYKLPDRLLLVLDTGRALAESDACSAVEARLAR